MKNKTKLTLVLIILLAFILRLAALFRYGDFWSDEMFNFVYSQRPWLDSITKFWVWETNPPLHTFLLKLWFYIFPANEFWTRMPSLIFGGLSIYFIYLFAKKLFNDMTGLICAGLLAVGSYHIFISDTARVYSIFVFLTIIVSMYFYETFLTDNASKKNKIIFAAAALFLLYAHLTAAVLLFGQFLYLLIFKKTRTVSWIKTMIIPIVLWLIWAIPSFYFKFTNPSLGQAWYFQISNEWTEKAQSLQPLFTGPSPLYFGLIMMMLFLLAVAFTIFKQRQAKADNPNFKWLIFSAALPIAAMALLNIWNIKFFIISWPFIFIIIGYLLNLYINSNLILITAILVFSLPGLVGLTKILPINDWHQTNAYLNQEYNKNKKQIVIYTHFSDKYHIDRYYTGQIPDMPYYPDSFTGKHDWDFDLITKNYLIHTFPKDETQKWIKEAKLENYTDLYLFYNSRENDNLKKTIEENGWKQAGIFKPRLLEYDELIKYVR